MEIDSDATDSETLIEFAGRSCYESYHKPNPKTAKNADYIERTIFEQKHGSIAEHATAVVYMTGISRACTHEIVRHRHAGYSQLSQRFVDESSTAIVLPPAVRGNEELERIVKEQSASSLQSYNDLVESLLSQGLPRKQAREAARSVLPNAVETKLVMSGNMRAWTEIINRRTAPDADAEIQQVMRMVKEELQKVSPVIFKDGR